MKTSVVKELLLGMLMLIPILYLALVWSSLPNEVPTHWGIDGKVDDFSSKESLIWLVIGLPLFIYLILRFAYLLDPKKDNYAAWGDSYYRLRLLLGIFMSFIVIAIIYTGQHGDSGFMSKGIVVGISLLFSGIGNYMPTMKPNWFVGIRTPWTLSNEEVWRKTHQMAGKLWFWGGLVSAALVLILPEIYGFYGFFGIILLIAVSPIVYSYQSYRKL